MERLRETAIPAMGVLTGGDGGVDKHEEVESYPLVGSDGVGGGRRGGLHGSRGATALMA